MASVHAEKEEQDSFSAASTSHDSCGPQIALAAGEVWCRIQCAALKGPSIASTDKCTVGESEISLEQALAVLNAQIQQPPIENGKSSETNIIAERSSKDDFTSWWSKKAQKQAMAEASAICGEKESKGIIFAILVGAEQLVQLLPLGRTEFERLVAGLFIQVALDGVDREHNGGEMLDDRRIVAQIASVTWDADPPYELFGHWPAAKLHFLLPIPAMDIPIVEKKITPGFVESSLRKAIKMGIPLPTREFILSRGRELKEAFSKTLEILPSIRTFPAMPGIPLEFVQREYDAQQKQPADKKSGKFAQFVGTTGQEFDENHKSCKFNEDDEESMIPFCYNQF